MRKSLARPPKPSGLSLRLAAALAAALAVACPGLPPSEAPTGLGDAASEQALFVDVARAVGLEFEHFAGLTGEFYYPEIVGSGAALFDADGDGDLDAYLVQGGFVSPTESLAAALLPPPGPLPLTDRLFRNELVEAGELRFTDVTAASGVHSTGYGMGVAVGDPDGDGDPDLYVTCVGPNLFLENLGGLRFRDATARTGTAEERWSTSAAFVDYDRDGWPDLMVGNYVDFNLGRHKPCRTTAGALDYCGPRSYHPLPNRLFRNRGDGTFEDATGSAGIVEHGGALGILARDFDGDGWVDLYVANDGRANQLWMNQRDGRFRNEALVAGCAYNQEGAAEASMGVDAGDFDGDGDDDLFLTHLRSESNTLYLNDGQGLFEDVTFDARLGVSSQPYTSFGTAWIDADNDGWLDLLVVNGDVQVLEDQRAAGVVPPLKQSNQFFRNLGNGRFEDLSARAGAAFQEKEVSRGAAFGDVDGDGDTDVLVVNNSGPARLLLNQVGQESSWLGLRLVAREGGWDAHGARAGCVLPDGRTLWRSVRPEGSYLSANDPRVLFGLGEEHVVTEVRVRWADGAEDRWPWAARALGHYVTLVPGSGEPRVAP